MLTLSLQLRFPLACVQGTLPQRLDAFYSRATYSALSRRREATRLGCDVLQLFAAFGQFLGDRFSAPES